jgi:sporulation protein YlmC with PRC-barrel domain
MRWDEIKDTPVMSIAEGTKLGSVHDLLLDDSYLQIAALVIGGGGLLGGQRRAVAYSAVRGIGRDAVMVSGQEAVQGVGDDGSLGVTHRLGELQQDVMSESGVHLGRVADVEFDPATGALTALRFIPTGATPPAETDASIIDRAQIVQLTAKMVVVQHAVLEQSTGEADAGRTPALGQVVGQEPAGAPVRDVRDNAAAIASERTTPTAPASRLSADEPAVNRGIGQEPPVLVADRSARK